MKTNTQRIILHSVPYTNNYLKKKIRHSWLNAKNENLKLKCKIANHFPAAKKVNLINIYRYVYVISLLLFCCKQIYHLKNRLILDAEMHVAGVACGAQIS